MKVLPRFTFGLALAVISLVVISPACADPKTYEWQTTSGWLFSAHQDAIEAITGQTSTPVNTSIGLRYFVPGAMRGRFTYDPENANVPVNFWAHFWSHADAFTDWSSELESSGSVIGTYTGDAGQVIVAEGNDAPGVPNDLINVNMCANCPGATGFSVNDWVATDSSIVWNGEGFQVGIDLPSALPPANAPIPLGIFSFYNQATNVNSAIWSHGLDIREAVQVVEIDVKPGAEPNCFNVNGHGVIPVAILGGPDVDVANIEQSSLSFGELAVGVRGNKFPTCSAEHVDGDEYIDLVCQFVDDSSAWVAGSEEAILQGALLDGTPIVGTDTICLKP